jgi:hypothetical protein
MATLDKRIIFVYAVTKIFLFMLLWTDRNLVGT